MAPIHRGLLVIALIRSAVKEDGQQTDREPHRYRML
jgi:hypothetical protein